MKPSREGLEALVAGANRGTGPNADVEDESRPYVFVRTTSRWFAIDAHRVREVLDQPEISRIPAAPPYVTGLALVHGRLIPAIDVDRLLGVGDTRIVTRRMVVVGDDQREIGLLAARVHGLVDVDARAARGSRPDRAAWIRCELRHEDRDVGVIEVSNLIETATSAFARTT